MTLSLSLVAAGCGGAFDDLPRQHVSGTVTLDGKPLESGTIQFMPAGGGSATAEGQGPTAIGGGAMIEAGAYDLPRDTGLVPGRYRVNIFSTEEVPGFKEGAESDGGGDDAGELPGESAPTPSGRSRKEPMRRARERVPARYNAASELTAEVTSGGDNAFTFDLQSR